jgi:hypothetical protein
MELAERKKIELEQKLKALKSEVQEWCARSEAGKPLQKHHTQIRAVAAQVEGCRAEIDADLKARPADLALCSEVEQALLGLYRLWDYFRAKLALRAIEWSRDLLAAMDELAWACYEPAQLRVTATHVAKESVKEPPLIYFHDRVSPVAMPRRLPYDDELVLGGGMQGIDFDTLVRGMPVPLVGLPWHQVRHLPQAVLIAHEVGHHVEDDMRLSPRLQELLDPLEGTRIPKGRLELWRDWIGEIFADVYGTLAVGPAFPSALFEVLALDAAAVAAESEAALGAGPYPSRLLRLLIVTRVLERLCHPESQRKLPDAWRGLYPAHALPIFEPDAEAIADALLDGPYPELGGCAMQEVLQFCGATQEEVEAELEWLQQGRLSKGDPRLLFALAHRAFEADPAGYDEARQNRIVNQVLAYQKSGPRTTYTRWSTAEQRSREAAQRASGTHLFLAVKRQEVTGRS